MDDTKKKEAPVDSDPTGPVEFFTEGNVSASVFRHEYETKFGKKPRYSVSFSRSYRNSNGERRYVKAFGVEDFASLDVVKLKAEKYIRQRQDEELA